MKGKWGRKAAKGKTEEEVEGSERKKGEIELREKVKDLKERNVGKEASGRSKKKEGERKKRLQKVVPVGTREG